MMREFNLYFAGWGLPTEKNALYEHGYNRLHSYYYDTKFVDFSVERKNLMKSYLSGICEDYDDKIYRLIETEGLWKYELNKSLYNSNAKLFIDSGAYSAWTQGVKIDVDNYIEWINNRSNNIYLYGQVDTIPVKHEGGIHYDDVVSAAESSWCNYLYMRSKVNNPDGLLYTFHVGEPDKYILQALSYTEHGAHIPYIALGGMVGKSFKTRLNFLTKVFGLINNSSNAKVKVHTFGMTDKILLESFPITSADSTAWIMSAVSGGIMTDFGIINISNNQYLNIPESVRLTVEEFGFSLIDLLSDVNNRMIYNVRYMYDRMSRLRYIPSGRRTLF